MPKFIAMLVPLIASACAFVPTGDRAATLCQRAPLTEGAIVVARGTLWSDSQHGAYLRDNACPNVAARLGIHPADPAPSVAALLDDLARSAWPHGVTYRIHAVGRITHTSKGQRMILSEVISYEKTEHATHR